VVDLQLDAQNSYLFTFTLHLLKSSTCFEQYPAHLQEVYVIVYLSCLFNTANLDDWLTVYRSTTLVDLQLDAQYSYLFTYNKFIKILYMFRALPCSSSGSRSRSISVLLV
jgi:hypothetical protein